VRVVPGVPSGPDDPVAALRTANARLREVIQAKDELLAARDAQVTVLAAQAGALAARVAELERRPGKDSPDSSRPPSPDSPHANKPRDRSLRERGKRPPGKQPGAQSPTLQQVAEAPPPVRPDQPPPAEPGMIPLTIPEIKRLLAALTTRPLPRCSERPGRAAQVCAPRGEEGPRRDLGRRGQAARPGRRQGIQGRLQSQVPQAHREDHR